MRKPNAPKSSSTTPVSLADFHAATKDKRNRRIQSKRRDNPYR